MILFGLFKTLSVKTQFLTTKKGLNIVLITVNSQNTPDIQRHSLVRFTVSLQNIISYCTVTVS